MHAVADAAALVAAVDEQPPQVGLRVGGRALGQHHEPGQLAVGLDGPVPRHDRHAVDGSPGYSASANDSAIGATNRCWLRWVARRSTAPAVVRRDLDQADVRPGGAAVVTPTPRGRRRSARTGRRRPTLPTRTAETAVPSYSKPSRSTSRADGTLAGSSEASMRWTPSVVEEPVDDRRRRPPWPARDPDGRAPACSRAWRSARRRRARRRRLRRAGRRAVTAIWIQSPATGPSSAAWLAIRRCADSSGYGACQPWKRATSGSDR